MTAKEKNDPQKGEFIDLEKTEFKKKSNFFVFFLKSLFFAILFFSLGFFINQVIDPNIYDLSFQTKTKQNKIESDDDVNVKDNEKLQQLNKELAEVSEKIKSSDLIFDNLENKLNQMRLKIDEMNERALEVDQKSYKEYFDQEFKQYRLLKNYLIFKDNFLKRKELGEEVFFIANYLKDSLEAQNIINFLNNTTIQNVATEAYLLDQINEQIKNYELEFDDFFVESDNNAKKDNQKFVKSKEDFFNYLGDVFNSTFKIVKYKKPDVEENIKKNGSYKKNLQKAKEFLIIGDLSSASEVIEQSNLNMTFLNDWSLKIQELINVKIKIGKLESLVFEILGKDFD